MRYSGLRPCLSRGSLTGLAVLSVAAGVLLLPAYADAQASTTQTGQPAAIFQLPPLVVTAQKEPAEAQTLPLSLTTVSKSTLTSAGVQIVSDAAMYAPNLQFSEFTARKLSNARFRGIGASPANPSITTLFDGVPQLHANSASVDLVDVEQVEFVRGPQSALFGRNALGGLINVTSVRPSLGAWSSSLSVPLANSASRDVRGGMAGPIVEGRLGMSVSLQYGHRDGFTVNDITGNDLDSRSAFAGKGQLLWTPASNWEARFIINGERARDGDYALSDLGGLRRNPFHTARDFEGYTHRNVLGTTIVARREGSSLTFTTTTGFVKWQTEDATDLDYSPLPLLRRNNVEESFQFTQEVRVASPTSVPIRVSDRATLKWQAGVFLFTQNYDQDAANTFSPYLLSPFIPFEISQTSPQSALDDSGVGVFGQGTATLGERIDLTAGVRVDHEQKDAQLSTFFTPPIAPRRNVVAEEGFSNVSPQFAAAFRVQNDKTVYASVGKGYKAGGFNAASPAGSESYDEEHTWNVEGGVKTMWANDRVAANAAVFRIDWKDLQLNLPNPLVPGEFFIANVGGAISSGVEFELNARVHSNVDVFGTFGYTRARFRQGSVSGGLPVGDNAIPYTPDYTAAVGAQVARNLRPGASMFARAEVSLSGAFEYDDLNTEGQEAYALTNFRAGVRGRYVFVEGWVKNAFDTRYIPVAFAYGPLAPSGFIGEMGRPRTFGISSGVTF